MTTQFETMKRGLGAPLAPGGTVARPLRVLIVAPGAPLVGGQAVQARRLVENLSREADLKVTWQPVNPQLPGILRRLQGVKYLRTLVTSIAYIAALVAAVPFYDIIHIFSAGDSSFVLATTPAVLIARLFGKKAILNYRHGGAEEHLKKWRRTALPTMRLFDRIIVPSGFLIGVFARFGLAAHSIYNFVSTERYRFRERPALRPVFFSNRNFDRLYNVGCIVRAFAVVQEQYPGARLLIAGDGEERAELEHLAAELKLQNVEFLGRVRQEQMPELYDRADIYLNSPNVDNMPTSVIEAFACGLPVVTTDAGGIPFIVEHEKNGLLVAKNDFEAMAREALRLLAEDGLAQKIIANARRECVKYSWENVRGAWVAAYLDLASRNDGREI